MIIIPILQMRPLKSSPRISRVHTQADWFQNSQLLSSGFDYDGYLNYLTKGIKQAGRGEKERQLALIKQLLRTRLCNLLQSLLRTRKLGGIFPISWARNRSSELTGGISWQSTAGKENHPGYLRLGKLQQVPLATRGLISTGFYGIGVFYFKSEPSELHLLKCYYSSRSASKVHIWERTEGFIHGCSDVCVPYRLTSTVSVMLTK